MVDATSPSAARKRAREHAAKLLDAEDAERRRLEAARRKRISDAAADIAGNDAEIDQLTARIEELQADTSHQLAAIVADGVSVAKTAEMTGREERVVKAAVKTRAAGRAPSNRKGATVRSAVAETTATA